MTRERGDRPNVVIFFPDQQRHDTMGLHGNPMGLTPTLDRMALEGTHCYHGFSPQPLCTPARACLLTGQWQTRTGVFHNRTPLRPETPTLAHHFGRAGYATGYIGKWHLASQMVVPRAQRGGFEYWLASNSPDSSTDAYGTVLYDNDDQPVRLPGYRVDAKTDAAIRYIDTHQQEPFFLVVGQLEPHQQNRTDHYYAPDGYRERYTGGWVPPDLAALGGDAHQHLGGYYGSVKRLDEAFARLLDALKSLDLLENTVVLYTSDHANHFNTRNKGCKRSCHESSIRVPMVLRGPGLDGGGRLQQPITLLDLAPTLLDAAGLPVPDEMQGRSIMPLVRGEGTDWPEEALIMIGDSQVGRAVRTRRWKYGVSAPGLSGTEHLGAERYVEEYLYDLHADPHELMNLAGSPGHREVASVMRERLIRRMMEAGESAPTVDPAPERIPLGPARRVRPEETRQ